MWDVERALTALSCVKEQIELQYTASERFITPLSDTQCGVINQHLQAWVAFCIEDIHRQQEAEK